MLRCREARCERSADSWDAACGCTHTGAHAWGRGCCDHTASPCHPAGGAWPPCSAAAGPAGPTKHKPPTTASRPRCPGRRAYDGSCGNGLRTCSQACVCGMRLGCTAMHAQCRLCFGRPPCVAPLHACMHACNALLPTSARSCGAFSTFLMLRRSRRMPAAVGTTSREGQRVDSGREARNALQASEGRPAHNPHPPWPSHLPAAGRAGGQAGSITRAGALSPPSTPAPLAAPTCRRLLALGHHRLQPLELLASSPAAAAAAGQPRMGQGGCSGRPATAPPVHAGLRAVRPRIADGPHRQDDLTDTP